MIGDKDLISIQQARILAENAADAQTRLSAMPQESLDTVVEAMAEAAEIDLIDVTSRMAARLPQYDRIGFASGIYYSKFHDTVVHYAAQYLPEGKETFFVCTHGSTACPEKYYAAITEAVKAKNCPILGTFSCRGYDTFGPFKLIGGMAKGHPDADDLQRARAFIQAL